MMCEKQESNDNNERWSKYTLLPWGHYDRLGMTAFGPIGIIDGVGFEYIDVRAAELRS